MISADEFERLVVEAIDALPAVFREKLDNIDVTIEPWPDAYALQRTGVRRPSDLLGLYQGVPQTRRTHRYGLVLPDKITLYRGPIMMRCRTETDVQPLVEHVLRHEIAHHFGIDDDHLRHIGAY
ncbi:MAG: metallopeptidase family protein [Anaerolineales bacterium]